MVILEWYHRIQVILKYTFLLFIKKSYIITIVITFLIGTKGSIIDAIKRHDMDFVTIFNKAIPPASQYFVTVKMGTGLLTSLEESNLELSSVGPLVVTKGMLRQLLPNSRLEANLMDRLEANLMVHIW